MLTETQKQTVFAIVSISVLVIIALLAAFSGTTSTPVIDSKGFHSDNPSGEYIQKQKVGQSNSFTASTQNASSQDEMEHSGTEFLPTVLGYRIKITDAFLVIFTAALALSTILLWASTNRLANETADSITLARNEFLSTHRPRLIVRQCELVVLEINKPIVVRCAIVNVGDTPAIPKRQVCNVALYNGIVFESPGIKSTQEDWQDRAISAGERQHLYCTSIHVVTERLLEAIESCKLHVCFLGELAYKDTTAAGVERRTGFYRTYIKAKDKFDASKDDEEEYCD